MPRKPRIHYPSAVYHVILRGNDRQSVFFEDGDRFKLYLFLQESVKRFGYRIHGFCFMTNHVHLIVQVANNSLSLIIQNLSLRYTKWINFSQERTGHLFQGRYKAILLDADTYLLELVRYVHLNPVRVKMVSLPEDYRWSGHRAYLGKEVLPWLTTDWILSQFSRSLETGRKAYQEFIADGMDEGRRNEFHSGTCEGRILGDDNFADSALYQSNQLRIREWTLPEVVASVCNSCGITVEELRTPSKVRHFSRSRALVAIMVLETPHLSLTALANVLNFDASALGKAAQRMLSLSLTDPRVAEDINALRVELKKCPNV